MSRLAETETLLRAVAAAAMRGEALPQALARVDGALAREAAARLSAGADLAQALGGLVPTWIAAALGGSRPPLEQAALLAAEELAAARRLRARWIALLAHPVLTVLAVAGGTLAMRSAWGLGLALPWLGAALAIAVGAVGVAVHATTARRSALARHATLAHRYERAALAARWRLPEAQLGPWLGGDLGPLGAVLARPDAETHCRSLAAHHRAAAGRAQERLGRLLTVMLLAASAAALLAAAAPVIDVFAGIAGQAP